jgi:hypothetical protein
MALCRWRYDGLIPGQQISPCNPRSRCHYWGYVFEARGFGGRHAPTMSPRQLKEVIQVALTNVGSVAPLGALVGREVHR